MRVGAISAAPIVALLMIAPPAFAATPVSPTPNQVVTDTHTPTFVVQLDTTTQPDGQPTDYSDVGIFVTGSDGHGGTTTVAFCNATDLGGGRVGCSDPSHPLPNGIYLWGFMYRTHTCIQLPPIGGYQAPPTCNFAFFPAVTGGIFQVAVPSAPPAPPPPPTDVTAPTVVTYAAHGHHGSKIRLRFSVHDNSGEADVVVGVYRGGRTITTHDFGLQPLDGVYYATWTPARAGKYRFCALAQDTAGNRSSASCSTVTVT